MAAMSEASPSYWVVAPADASTSSRRCGDAIAVFTKETLRY